MHEMTFAGRITPPPSVRSEVRTNPVIMISQTRSDLDRLVKALVKRY